VSPTNEELMIALHTRAALAAQAERLFAFSTREGACRWSIPVDSLLILFV